MKARPGSMRFAATVSRAHPTSTVSLFLTLFATGSALAVGTPEQRKACTPDVYRLCVGEIPNVRPQLTQIETLPADVHSAIRSR
jgi:hypothetical protein